MNDRFKFRGYWYNDVQKEWWVYDEPEFITGDGTAEIWSNAEGGAYSELPSDAELHLCQCTGLKDKNGKLIYEGDILKLAEFGKPVEVKHRALGFVLRREPSNTVGYDNDKYIPEDCKVIGNIYENKELLNNE